MDGTKPRMSDLETAAFLSFARSATSYFEFGIGGSTYEAGRLVDGRVVAIDSDPKWVDKAAAAQVPSKHERILSYIDIGPTGDWGYPLDMTNTSRFVYYYSSILNHNPRKFDFCLVDGRFRVACFLTAIANVRSDAIVAIHDYRCRPYYHVAEEFGRIVMEVEDIAFFVRRHDMDATRLEEVLRSHSSDPQ